MFKASYIIQLEGEHDLQGYLDAAFETLNDDCPNNNAKEILNMIVNPYPNTYTHALKAEKIDESRLFYDRYNYLGRMVCTKCGTDFLIMQERNRTIHVKHWTHSVTDVWNYFSTYSGVMCHSPVSKCADIIMNKALS